MQTALPSITPTGHLRLGRATTFGGQAVIGISGSLTGAPLGATASSTLYVTLTSDPLPVGLVTKVEASGHPVSTATVTMSDWGERLNVAPPTDTVPMTEVLALTRELSPFEIPTAFGYYTFSGPRGLPMAFSRPWGLACKPIVFRFGTSVPARIYDEAAPVIDRAHNQGDLDVTAATRTNNWHPNTLYYGGGQTPKTITVVDIFDNYGKPPALANGKPEDIKLTWDAKLDRDKRNEDLTNVQGFLWNRVVAGHPQLVRRAIRQLIAMTQGVDGTTLAVSGISNPASVDRFTLSDDQAMLRMSGCDTAPVGS
jgi:hypothetical protein